MKQLTHGSFLFEKEENRTKYPSYVIFPQCAEDDYWASRSDDTNRVNGKIGLDFSKPANKALEEVFEIINYYRDKDYIDRSRVYIMGLSMGGRGTIEAITRYPDIFAAAIPICGGGDLRYSENFAKKVPVWVFHGAKDDVVLPSNSRDLVAAIKKLGGKPKYTEFPDVNHNSWDSAFATKDLLEWLFEQKNISESK